MFSFAKSLNKDISIVAFAPQQQWEAAKRAGAKYVGSFDLVAQMLSADHGIKFDRCVATLDQMPVIAKLARVLGPLGMMPNIKTGTLTNDIIDAIKKALTNTPFKVDRENALLQVQIATSFFTPQEIKDNLKVVFDWVGLQNKTTDNGQFMESATLILDDLIIPLAKDEHASSEGPKYLKTLAAVRAAAAKREKEQLAKKKTTAI